MITPFRECCEKMLDNHYLERVLMPWSITRAITSVDRLNHLELANTSLPYALIVNTAPYPQNGHWLTLIFNSTGSCIFFDPLGASLPHQPDEISSFIAKNSISVEFNLNQIQDINSNFCGFFCISKIISFMLNESHLEFSNHFARDTMLNDTRVVKLIISHALHI